MTLFNMAGPGGLLRASLPSPLWGGANYAPVKFAPGKFIEPLTIQTLPGFSVITLFKIILPCKNHNSSNMAGPGGFEPPHDGIKTRCLTAWRRPNSFCRFLNPGSFAFALRTSASRDHNSNTGRCLTTGRQPSILDFVFIVPS